MLILCKHPADLNLLHDLLQVVLLQTLLFDDFDGNVLIQFQVEPLVHFPEGALTQYRSDVVFVEIVTRDWVSVHVAAVIRLLHVLQYPEQSPALLHVI